MLARACEALVSMILSCARSMLDCEPSENEEYPSEMNIGVVLLPSWRCMRPNENASRLVAK